MLRNRRDVVRSLQNMSWAPRKIRWSIRRWIDSVQAGRAFGSKLPPNQYCEIRYEDLIGQPEATLRRLCEFLGESFAPQMLASHEPRNNSWNYAFKPLQSTPVGKYRNLNLVERVLFNRLAGPLMRALEYE